MKTSPDRTAAVQELEERLLKKWRKEHPNEPLPETLPKKKEKQDDTPPPEEE